MKINFRNLFALSLLFVCLYMAGEFAIKALNTNSDIPYMLSIPALLLGSFGVVKVCKYVFSK